MDKISNIDAITFSENFISRLSQAKLTKTLPQTAEFSIIRQQIAAMAELLSEHGLIEGVEDNQIIFNKDNVETLSQSNSQTRQLIGQISKIINSIGQNSAEIREGFPNENSREQFHESMIYAARVASSMGIFVDTKAISRFNDSEALTNKERETHVKSIVEQTPEFFASEQSLTHIRQQALDTLTTLRLIPEEAYNSPIGEILKASTENLQDAFHNAKYIVPGDNEVRRSSFASQKTRGDRIDAATIASGSRLLSFVLSQEETQRFLAESLKPINYQLAQRQIAELQESVEQVQASARENVEHSKNNILNPEQSKALIDLLITGLQFGSSIQIGLHTEIASNEQLTQQDSFSDRVNDLKEEEKESGRDTEELSVANFSSFANELEHTENSAAIGTVIADRKRYQDYANAIARIEKSGAIEKIENIITQFKNLREIETKIMKENHYLGETETRIADKVATTREDYLDTNKGLQSLDKTASTLGKNITKNQEEAKAIREYLKNSPFQKIEDAQEFLRLIKAGQELIKETPKRNLDSIIIREDLMEANEGPATNIANNHRYLNLCKSAHVDTQEVYTVIEARGQASHATLAQLAASLERESVERAHNITTNLAQELERADHTKPIMTTGEFRALAKHDLEKAKRNPNLFFFDPNKPYNPKDKSNTRGLVNYRKTYDTPISLDDYLDKMTPLERSFRDRLFNDNGSVNKTFQNELLDLRHKKIICDQKKDGEVLVKYIDLAEKLQVLEREKEIAKATQKMPQSSFELPIGKITEFIDFARTGDNEDALIAIRTFKNPETKKKEMHLVLEHPDSRTITAINEVGTDEVKSWVQKAVDRTGEATGKLHTNRETMKVCSVPLDRIETEVEKMRSLGKNEVAFTLVGTMLRTIGEHEKQQTPIVQDTPKKAKKQKEDFVR